MSASSSHTHPRQTFRTEGKKKKKKSSVRWEKTWRWGNRTSPGNCTNQLSAEMQTSPFYLLLLSFFPYLFLPTSILTLLRLLSLPQTSHKRSVQYQNSFVQFQIPPLQHSLIHPMCLYLTAPPPQFVWHSRELFPMNHLCRFCNKDSGFIGHLCWF